MPTLARTPKNDIMLSWTEKDADGKTAICMALSSDNGKTFTDKKTVASGYGISNSRLMRAKVLAKKDGSFAAVFMNNPNATPPQPAPTTANAGPDRGGRGGGGGGGGRGGQLAYCTSKDGNTWTSPQAVDTDPSPNLMRGFFGATILANDELAVAYLKDVKNSTKHEERDLRISITKNGAFEAEKLIDAVVCDCCNISLLVDNKGVLNVYYRDNNDDIRDMALMSSTDNGQTFSKPQIVYNDHWKIVGCPHNGPTSVAMGKTNLVTWYSAGDNEKGLRLTTQEGQKLSIISDPTAKNGSVAADGNNAVFCWEQNNAAASGFQIAYQIINKSVSEVKWINETGNSNATSLMLGNEVMMAYEQKQEGKKNRIKISKFNL
jgi:hypothetical protein